MLIYLRTQQLYKLSHSAPGTAAEKINDFHGGGRSVTDGGENEAVHKFNERHTTKTKRDTEEEE